MRIYILIALTIFLFGCSTIEYPAPADKPLHISEMHKHAFKDAIEACNFAKKFFAIYNSSYKETILNDNTSIVLYGHTDAISMVLEELGPRRIEHDVTFTLSIDCDDNIIALNYVNFNESHSYNGQTTYKVHNPLQYFGNAQTDVKNELRFDNIQFAEILKLPEMLYEQAHTPIDAKTYLNGDCAYRYRYEPVFGYRKETRLTTQEYYACKKVKNKCISQIYEVASEEDKKNTFLMSRKHQACLNK